MADETARRDFPDQAQRLAVCFQQWRRSKQRGEDAPWNHLLGVWGIDPDYLTLYRPRIEAFLHGEWAAELPIEARGGPEDLIQLTEGGIAVIPIHGPLMKHQTLLGAMSGTASTRMIQQALRQAVAAEDVRAVMLHVESPGGHVAGMHELAETVRTLHTRKPIAAHIEDLGASAAYWAIAHTDRITANAPAEVGSLRTMAIVADASQRYATAGIKVHVVTRAQYKGLGVEGTTLAPEHLAEIQRRVDAQDAFFLKAIQQGRQLDKEALERVTDGRVWIASEAQALGLVDEVRPFEVALRDLGRMIGTSRREEVRSRIAQQRAAFHEQETAHADSGGAEKSRNGLD
jgi:signal peptide peptidase SppA